MSRFVTEQRQQRSLAGIQQIFRYFSACSKNQQHADTLSNSGERNSFDKDGNLTKQTSDGRGGMIFDKAGRKIHTWAPGLRCD